LELGKCKVALFVLTFALTVSVGIVVGFLVDKYPRTDEDPLVVENNSLYTTGNLSSNSCIKH
jgi:predicted membrane-bound mannosyltransferase